MDGPIKLHMWLVTAVCLYVNTAGLRRGPEKCFWGPGKSWNFFVTKRVRAPIIGCASKNDTDVTRYSFDIHRLILTFFGRNVADRVSCQTRQTS